MFDWRAAVATQTSQKNLFAALGGGMGAPPCIMALGMEALKLLPTGILADIEWMADDAGGAVDDWFEKWEKWIEKKFGGYVKISPNGKITLVNNNSWWGSGKGLQQLMGFTQALANNASRLYATGVAAYGEFQKMKNCIEIYAANERFHGANTLTSTENLTPQEFNAFMDRKLGPILDRLDQIAEVRQGWEDLSDRCAAILESRIEDPSLEPLLIGTTVDINGQSVELSSLGFNVSSPIPPEEEAEIFRLVFGPPVAREGQFIVSKDGLYYDSQSSEVSGVTLALNTLDQRKAKVPLADRWKFEFDPNLGGKGVQISSKTVMNYVGTIFDPEIIDDSSNLRTYYDQDHFLKTIEGQKAKRIYDLSSHLAEFAIGGASEAVIYNTRQSIYSEIALFKGKINKRKKQIEVAVKIPNLYGAALFKPGEVPINDFSYLQQFNFANKIHKQKALVLDQADVRGVISPISPKFVTSKPKDEIESSDHLFIAEIGTGDILYSNSASSTIAPRSSVTPALVEDRLFGVYNFLESNVVNPSSSEFNVTNCSVEDITNNLQLVGNTPSSVFPSGLCIPRLDGITKQREDDMYYPSGVGSFVKLPEGKEFEDYTYNPEGFSFESWMYVPDLTNVARGWTDNGASSLYRLVLANENNGIDPNYNVQTKPERLDLDLGDGIVQGMVMGFTRDRRIAKGLDYSNESYDNLPTSSLAFFAAPTQSINDTSVGFIHNGCNTDINPSWYSFTVDASAGTSGLLSSTNQFSHMAFTVDPPNDKVSLYINGDLLATSSLRLTFGRELYDPIKVPSFKKANSFEYSGTMVEASAAVALSGGPRANAYFPCTVLGGGYTDGIGGKGFMGNTTYGAISGLRGHLGSVKFYSKPLGSGEVQKNYNAQKDVFENMQTLSTYTEDGS